MQNPYIFMGYMVDNLFGWFYLCGNGNANMIPVLDKGYAKLYASTCTGVNFTSTLLNWHCGRITENFLKLPQLTIETKCPLFVQLWLSENNLTIISKKGQTDTQAFIPTVADIGGQTLENNEAIQADIARTTDALLINPKAYQADNCDKFMSQVMTPISVYSELLINGNLLQWIKLTSQTSLPKPVEAYRLAFYSIMASEWPNINEITRSVNNGSRQKRP